MYRCPLCIHTVHGYTRQRVLMRHLRRHHGADFQSAMEWVARSEKVDPFGKPVVTGLDILRAAVCIAVIVATLWFLCDWG